MNRKYNLKLDLQFRCNNSTMKFDEFDNNTSDFFIRVTRAGELIDISKAIVTLVVIKPDNSVDAQFVDIDSNRAYCDLKPTMKNLVGKYEAIASITVDGETVNTGIDNPIIYEVTENKFLRQLNQKVVTEERFTLLTDMINRLSTIEISEEQRVINEAERILSEENRKIEEAKRVEAELIRQHEEADRAKYDATRESNENIRKQNESIRLANEANRIDEETKRVEEENKRKLAEEERNANYNFMTEDEERRRLEANAHKEAEVLRVQAETNRVNEEAKRRTTEQARVLAENTRVSNENTRKANEETRQNNETHRVEAETQRQNRYNSFIADAEVNANNFENYTNSAKVKEEERKSNELNRKSQEDRRVSNEVERISNENARKANEVAREKNETSRQNIFENKVDEVDTKISEIDNVKDNFVSSINTKVDTKISEIEVAKSDMTNTVSNKINEVETRFNALTSSQQQDAEVIDARDGETSLKSRLDRDIEKAKQVYVNVEGSHISTDSNVGYLKDVEILGNTIQSASNLADIRSVGDKIEGQELYEIPVLSVGKNIWNTTISIFNNNKYLCTPNYSREVGVKLPKNSSWTLSFEKITRDARVYIWGGNNSVREVNPNISNKVSFTLNGDEDGISFYAGNFGNSPYDEITTDFKIQLEEGTQATPYEPYVEDKLTILSPTQLEKVGDVCDRIIEKDGVWGVEKNVIDKLFNGSENWVLSGWAPQENTIAFKLQNTNNTNLGICDKFILNRNNSTIDTEAFNVDSVWNEISIRINKSKLSTQDVTGFKKWLSDNTVLIMYSDNTSTFIPLPHDQQIKLRTFANKTNISFLTEIEGTIKAQVPKSLGATVNTHTEQINNLNKELDRVKKLEESTVSTVTTESDFTTVEATSNGYFEDVKLEGKTLVNLATQPANNGAINNQYATISTVTNIKPSTVYTYIIRNNGSETLKLYLNHNGGFDWFDLDVEANSTVIGKARTLPTIDGDIWLSLSEAETIEQNLQVVLLEGDHTQNPPSFFEGLKSVGEDVEEVSVKSVDGDGNLFDGEFERGSINLNTGICYENNYRIRSKNFNRIIGDCYVTITGELTANPSNAILYYDSSKNYIDRIYLSNLQNIKLPQNAHYFKLAIFEDNGIIVPLDIKISVYKGTTPKTYTPHQSDKKRLLYYNEETQTWEKPILREWDSIEKHADGKYYYHQRSAEVVLNGSENWLTYSQEDNGCYSASLTLINSANYMGFNVVCDKFNSLDAYGALYYGRGSGIYVGTRNTSDGNVIIGLKNEDLPSRDVAGFKTKLQTLAPITAVYKLAKEKVYECINIDLITYANETNYIVESGVLSPRTTLKVHSNISNVVSLLQKKVSLLESDVTSYMITQNRLMLASRYNSDTVSFKVDYAVYSENMSQENYDTDLYNLILNNILVGKDNYDYDHMFNIIMDYASWSQISWDQFDILVGLMDIQHNPPIEEIPTDDEIVEEIPNEIM